MANFIVLSRVMAKKFWFFTTLWGLLVCGITPFAACAQSEWAIVKQGLELSNQDTLLNVTYDRNSNSVELFNPYAQTKDDRRNNDHRRSLSGVTDIEVYRTSSDPTKRILFTLSDLRDDTSLRYGVIDEKGKMKYTREIYFGITIHLKKTDGSDFFLCYMWFHGWRSWVEVYGVSCFSGKTLQEIETAHNTWEDCDRWSEDTPIIITLEGTNRCEITGTHKNVSFIEIAGVEKISFNVYEGAWIEISNFKIEQQTPYAKVKKYVEGGDSAVANECFLDAVEEYTKAIVQGYSNHDIYYKRAMAYFKCNFYNNCIDDCTQALSYKKTEESYFLRGMAKLSKSDISCVDDFRRGGVTGVAIAKEIEGANNIPEVPHRPLGTGSGFVVSPNGIIVSNYHVIEKANKVEVVVFQNKTSKSYNANILVKDKKNDLCLLQIDDTSFVRFPSLPYTIKTSIKDVGSRVFVLGYPMSSLLGDEVKVTDGIINSKTGFQGDISTYQISAPIQPGNSGGPLFDENGDIIGITNAGVPNAQNVGYAIKSSYLLNLIDVAPAEIQISRQNVISHLPFTEKVKRLSPYVVLIKVY